MPRILKFGTHTGDDKLYCVLKNQPHMAYQSLYLSIFLSFQIFFHHISSASMSALESSNFVYTMRTTKCITENKTNMLRFTFAFFFYFFPFSISHSKVMNMEIFDKNFSGTT